MMEDCRQGNKRGGKETEKRMGDSSREKEVKKRGNGEVFGKKQVKKQQ